MKHSMHIDIFSGGAARLPLGKRTKDNVLRALAVDPRISAFDMCEHKWLRTIISDLEGNGTIVELDEPFPWLRFKIEKQDADRS